MNENVSDCVRDEGKERSKSKGCVISQLLILSISSLLEDETLLEMRKQEKERLSRGAVMINTSFHY